jgi:hypothetical protein
MSPTLTATQPKTQLNGLDTQKMIETVTALKANPSWRGSSSEHATAGSLEGRIARRSGTSMAWGAQMLHGRKLSSSRTGSPRFCLATMRGLTRWNSCCMRSLAA